MIATVSKNVTVTGNMIGTGTGIGIGKIRVDETLGTDLSGADDGVTVADESETPA